MSRRGAAITTFVTGAANIVFGSLQSLVLTPIYIRRIGERLFGSWLSSGDVLSWIQAFDLGLPSILTQRIGAAHGRGDEEEIGRWLFSGIVSLGVVATFVVTAAILIAPKLIGWFAVAAPDAVAFERAFIVSAIATAGIILQYAVVGFARGIQRTGFMGTLMAASSPVGFGVSLVLVMRGHGLMSVAYGMLARTVVLLVGSVVFQLRNLTPRMRSGFGPDRRILRETLGLMPLAALGGVSYAAMNQSEFAVIGLTLDPVFASRYMVTRRASDVARALTDAVSFASYGSFAHLVSSDQRSQSLVVYAEILSLRTSLAFALVGAYVAMNASFVSVWVAPAMFGGTWLTALLGIQAIIGGAAFLANYLYRAMGAVAEGSVALAAEAVLRVLLMIGLVRTVGLIGVPLAAITTSIVFGVLAHRWSVERMRAYATSDNRVDRRLWFARLAFLALAILVGHYVRIPTWPGALSIGALVGGTGVLLLISLDSRAVFLRTQVSSAVSLLRNFASSRRKG